MARPSTPTTISAANPVRDLITVVALTLLVAFGYAQSLRAAEAYALAEQASGERDALHAQLSLLEADYADLLALTEARP